MGRTCEQLPASEALPDIKDHCVVFHNGKGYYYTCKDYSQSPEKRLFECVVPECKVTASMGSGLGAPLIDNSNHVHAADLTYREKCILLHKIRQRFLQEGSSIFFVLQEALSSLSLGENEDSVSAACNFETIKVEEASLDLEIVKEEPCFDTIEGEQLTDSISPKEVTISVPDDVLTFNICNTTGESERVKEDFTEGIHHDNDDESEMLLEFNDRSLEVQPVIQTYRKKSTSAQKLKSPTKPSTSHNSEPTNMEFVEECLVDPDTVDEFLLSSDDQSTNQNITGKQCWKIKSTEERREYERERKRQQRAKKTEQENEFKTEYECDYRKIRNEENTKRRKTVKTKSAQELSKIRQQTRIRVQRWRMRKAVIATLNQQPTVHEALWEQCHPMALQLQELPCETYKFKPCEEECMSEQTTVKPDPEKIVDDNIAKYESPV